MRGETQELRGSRPEMENAGLSGKEEKEEEGRKLIVGMCLTPSCREMLTWTIAKIAQPGDHILVLHVSTTSISGTNTFLILFSVFV